MSSWQPQFHQFIVVDKNKLILELVLTMTDLLNDFLHKQTYDISFGISYSQHEEKYNFLTVQFSCCKFVYMY